LPGDILARRILRQQEARHAYISDKGSDDYRLCRVGRRPNCGAGPSLDKQQQAFEEAQADDPDEAGLGQSIGRRSCVAEQSGLAK
jgi:hypothetical protein